MKYLYAVRNRITGKLVTGITNPSHKFWEREADCRSAMGYAWKKNPKYSPDVLEMVKFELVEVKTKNDTAVV